MIYYKEPSDRWTEVTIWSMGKSLKEIAAKLKRQAEAFPHKDLSLIHISEPTRPY